MQDVLTQIKHMETIFWDGRITMFSYDESKNRDCYEWFNEEEDEMINKLDTGDIQWVKRSG